MILLVKLYDYRKFIKMTYHILIQKKSGVGVDNQYFKNFTRWKMESHI